MDDALEAKGLGVGAADALDELRDAAVGVFVVPLRLGGRAGRDLRLAAGLRRFGGGCSELRLRGFGPLAPGALRGDKVGELPIDDCTEAALGRLMAGATATEGART